MKIITKLEAQNYITMPKKDKWYCFQDKDTDKVKIQSELSDPFNQEIVLLFSFQYKKTNRSMYAYAVIFKIFPVISRKGINSHSLMRECYKAEFSSYQKDKQVNQWFSFFEIKNKMVIDYYF